MENLINETADMITDYSEFSADIFRNQPFQRVNIAKAFEAGFTTHSEATRKVCDVVMRVAEIDVKYRNPIL